MDATRIPASDCGEVMPASDPAAFEREQVDKQILVETIGSVLWFLMDGFWMLNQGSPAKAMVLPTLGVNLWVFRYTRRSMGQICVVGAMNSWLLMNISWMIGDLDKDPRGLTVARAMFAAGMVLLAVAAARNAVDRKSLMDVLGRFRRMRM
ncbi:MAG TPA: hypothetical protein VER03_03115 [Bryobacteraceae bacterium]|nr:hypothetical protein [Bryobacteraceae bacterium]